MSKYLSNSNSFQPFPHQTRTDAQKTEKFYKECVDAGVSIIKSDVGNGIRATKENMLINIDLIGNKIHDEEVQRVVNPFGIEYGKLPNNYRNCPLLNSNLMLLWGEERKRYFNPVVTMVNSDAVNEKMKAINSRIDAFIEQQVVDPSMNEEQIKAKLQELDDWKNFNYRDRRERMAQQIISYGFNVLDLKEVFSQNFELLTITGDSLYATDIRGGEPILEKLNPVEVTTIRSGNSNIIEDSDIIIIDTYDPLGKVIDYFYDELTPSQIKKLEDGSNAHKNPSKGFMKDQLLQGPSDLDSYIQAVGIGEVVVGASKLGKDAFGGAFDKEGNVRRTRVLWKGMRKIGVLSYIDEMGEMQETFVDEFFEPDESAGQTVKWLWISEWMEGTHLANDIYLKLGPRPVQFRSMDNPSKCASGIVGVTANVPGAESKSIVDLAKPYQYMYNAVLQKMEMAIAKDFGNLGRLDLSMVPDEWSMDKWLYYAYMMGWMVEDPFNVGKKGAALGKLAGTMNQNSRNLDLSQGRYIGDQMQILQFLENRVDAITGITPQRKGSIDNRETVGGVERAVTQSSHITEKWFAIHDHAKVKALEAYLETAKVAWRGKSFKRNFLLDDSSLAILDFDWEVFTEAEYGIHVATSSSDIEMINQLKSLTQPFLQNGGSMSIIMDIFRTKDPSSLQRKIERYEKQMQEREQQANQATLEVEQEKLKREEELERYKIDMSYKEAIDTALIRADQGDVEQDEDKKIEIDREEFNKKLQLERDRLDETKRSNKAKEQIARSKPKVTSK